MQALWPLCVVVGGGLTVVVGLGPFVVVGFGFSVVTGLKGDIVLKRLIKIGTNFIFYLVRLFLLLSANTNSKKKEKKTIFKNAKSQGRCKKVVLGVF